MARAGVRSESIVSPVVAVRGTALPQDVDTLLQRALLTLSFALGAYAVASMMAAISATFAYVETGLLFGDPIERPVHLMFVIGLDLAVFLDFGALIAFLAASADLSRARQKVPHPLRRILESYRVALFASLGLGLASLPVLDLALTISSCVDCGPTLPPGVAQIGVLLLGASALLSILAILRIALYFRQGRRASMALVGAFLGVIAVIGEIASAFVFISGEWTQVGWIAFGGSPLVNWSPVWGSIAALGSGLMTWSYRPTSQEKSSRPPSHNSRPSGG